MVKAKVGEPIKIQWMFVNIYPHKTLENVVVHFFVVREAQGRPEGASRAERETSCSSRPSTWTSSRAARPGQRNTLRLDEPGVYLIRVESGKTQSDHEHFAAIDLVVEEK